MVIRWIVLTDLEFLKCWAGAFSFLGSWDPILPLEQQIIVYLCSKIGNPSTPGFLSIRQGRAAMLAAALMGGCLLAMIEGVGIVISRASASQFKPVMPTLPDQV